MSTFCCTSIHKLYVCIIKTSKRACQATKSHAEGLARSQHKSH